MLRKLFFSVCVFLVVSCVETREEYLLTESSEAFSDCYSTFPGPEFNVNSYEAEMGYLDKYSALDWNELPSEIDLSKLHPDEQALVLYMLEIKGPRKKIEKSEFSSEKPILKAVFASFTDENIFGGVDIKLLRQGLHQFYNCERKPPASITEFKRKYGDYKSWKSFIVDNSVVKKGDRHIYENIEIGVFVSETVIDEELREIEVIIDNNRKDGALDFFSYTHDGYLTNRGEFQPGLKASVASSPYTCLTCHLDTKTNRFTVKFPSDLPFQQ